VEAGDDFVGIDGLHDDLGVALGHPLMPHRGTAGGFISVIAPKKMPPGW
jgi:hypothetical protein